MAVKYKFTPEPEIEKTLIQTIANVNGNSISILNLKNNIFLFVYTKGVMPKSARLIEVDPNNL